MANKIDLDVMSGTRNSFNNAISDCSSAIDIINNIKSNTDSKILNGDSNAGDRLQALISGVNSVKEKIIAINDVLNQTETSYKDAKLKIENQLNGLAQSAILGFSKFNTGNNAFNSNNKMKSDTASIVPDDFIGPLVPEQKYESEVNNSKAQAVGESESILATIGNGLSNGWDFISDKTSDAVSWIQKKWNDLTNASAKLCESVAGWFKNDKSTLEADDPQEKEINSDIKNKNFDNMIDSSLDDKHLFGTDTTEGENGERIVFDKMTKDGNSRFYWNDGKIVKVVGENDNGRYVRFITEGKKTLYYEDGTIEIETEEGSTKILTIYNPDGSYQITDDGLGVSLTTYYSKDGIKLKTTEPRGYSTEYYADGTVKRSGNDKVFKEYDEHGNLIKEVDENGNVTEYDSSGEYILKDKTGIIREKHYADGSGIMYNEDGSIWKEINADGSYKQYYSELGGTYNDYAYSIYDAEGNCVSYKLYENGSVAEIVTHNNKPGYMSVDYYEKFDINGNRTTAYTEEGYLTYNPDGSYDVYGSEERKNIEKTVMPNGDIKIYQHYADGSSVMRTIEKADGSVEKYFGANNSLSEIKYPDGSSNYYDDDGFMRETVSADGTRTSYCKKGWYFAKINGIDATKVVTTPNGTKTYYSSDGTVLKVE